VAELLDDSTIELVVVAAPNAAHHELAAAALRADRHVVVDKPFTVTTVEANDLIALARERNRRLSVFHQRRWDSDHLTAERLVRSESLGDISTYIARYDRFLPEPGKRWTEQDVPGSGVLYDLGSHLIDQALHLFGLPATVLAEVGAQRPGARADDYLHVVLGYERLRAILHVGSLVRAPGPRLELHGDVGSFVTRGIDGQMAALLAGRRPGDAGWGLPDEGSQGSITTELAGIPLTGRLAGVPGAYEIYYRRMVAVLHGHGPVPVRPESARNVVRIIECALLSNREGRAVEIG
jgi:scyllo-inositol 2-dehydrogenase (NADP+)